MKSLSFAELIHLSKNKYSLKSEVVILKVIIFLSKKVKNRLTLTDNLNTPIDFKTSNFFKILDQYYFKKTPLAYILKYENFYNLTFKINKKVFIPRNETELLCEYVINKAKLLPKLEILDLCSGSGAIGITIKKYCPQHNIVCVDIDSRCIKNIKQNNIFNNAGIVIIKADYLKYILNSNKHYDILVCNPPYINSSYKLEWEVVKNNPKRSLFAKKDEFIFYKNIINNISKIMKQDFLLAFEIGFNQKPVLEQFLQNRLSEIEYKFTKDYAGLDRNLYIWNKGNKII